MKKIIWIAVGCLCIGLIGYGALGIAETPVAAELSQEAKGQFVRVDGKKLIVSVSGQETSYPISANVWVYRNNQKAALDDLKAGDAVEVILNSKQQAAYVKSSGAAESSQPQPSENAASQSNAAAASGTAAVDDNRPVPGPTLPPAAVAVTGAGAAGQSNTAQKPSGNTAGKPSSSSVAAGATQAWEKLAFEWKSRDFELKAKQEPGKLSASEMYLKMKDRSVIRLDGAAAESFIQLLVKELPKEPKAFEQALKQKIVSDFQLAGGSADWKLDVKWAEAPKSKGNEKPKSNGKEKEHGKGKEKRSDNDD